MPWLSVKDEGLPDLANVKSLEITSVELQDGKTCPPDYLTEAELIGMMEHNGIGTGYYYYFFIPRI